MKKASLMVCGITFVQRWKLAQNRRFSVIERQGLLYISDF